MRHATDLPQRRWTRLSDYDYGQPGAYFVTICTHRRERLLATLTKHMLTLSSIGTIVEDCWRALPSFFPHITLDCFIIMPDHMHGIIVINEAISTEKHSPTGSQAGSLPAIVQNFKSVSTRRVNQLRGTSGKTLWQRNYYERIIRNEDAIDRVRQYIRNNPHP